MLINQVSLHGFRRFRNKTSLRIPARVFALLGPNEAGKSSVLAAIQHVQGKGPIAEADQSHDARISGDRAIISVEYGLERSDFEALGSVVGAEIIRRFIVAKRADGNRTFSCDPPIIWDDSAAKAAAQEQLRRLPASTVPERVTAVMEILGLGTALDPRGLAQIGALLESLRAVEGTPPDTLSSLETLLHEIGGADPNQAATTILKTRMPRVVLFQDQDRNLASSYNIAQVAPNPPRALSNLLQVAGLDLNDLSARLADGPRTRRAEDKANKALKKAFANRWSQSGLTVSFRVNSGNLEIHIEDQAEAGSFTNVSERSDGFRQFVALLALLGQESLGDPILLVDEAEQHLHYDAQADLVRMFQEQQAVRQVIYTTHSAGCLPDDLGRGVGAVAPTNMIWSRFVNNFWHSEEELSGPGVRPLLVGMGASTLAFLPLRTAVFVEGRSDTLLLPELFREAIDAKDVGFQVVPGLSMASRLELALLNTQAPSVAYLVDGDEEGERLKALLLEAGVPEWQIAKLPAKTLEHCIDSAAYVRAVNSLLSRQELTEKGLGESGPSGLKEWCLTRKVKEPSKVAVAYALLRLSDEGPVLAPALRDAMRLTHQALLDIHSHPVTQNEGVTKRMDTRIDVVLEAGEPTFRISKDHPRRDRILGSVLSTGHGFTVSPEGGSGPWTVRLSAQATVDLKEIQSAIDSAVR